MSIANGEYYGSRDLWHRPRGLSPVITPEIDAIVEERAGRFFATPKRYWSEIWNQKVRGGMDVGRVVTIATALVAASFLSQINNRNENNTPRGATYEAVSVQPTEEPIRAHPLSEPVSPVISEGELLGEHGYSRTITLDDAPELPVAEEIGFDGYSHADESDANAALQVPTEEEGYMLYQPLDGRAVLVDSNGMTREATPEEIQQFSNQAPN